jgi:hypothetical protein
MSKDFGVPNSVIFNDRGESLVIDLRLERCMRYLKIMKKKAREDEVIGYDHIQ